LMCFMGGVHSFHLSFVRYQHRTRITTGSLSRQSDRECSPGVFTPYRGRRIGKNAPHEVAEFIQIGFCKSHQELADHIVANPVAGQNSECGLAKIADAKSCVCSHNLSVDIVPVAALSERFNIPNRTAGKSQIYNSSVKLPELD